LLIATKIGPIRRFTPAIAYIKSCSGDQRTHEWRRAARFSQREPVLGHYPSRGLRKRMPVGCARNLFEESFVRSAQYVTRTTIFLSSCAGAGREGGGKKQNPEGEKKQTANRRRETNRSRATSRPALRF